MKTFFAFFILLLTPYAMAQSFDHSLFEDLLQKYVNNSGLVNYDGFGSDPAFDQYLNSLQKANISGFDQNKKLAFYINAYNAFIIKNVIDMEVTDSPLKHEDFFTGKRFLLNGKKVSPDDVEKIYVLPINRGLSHFGLVCAAVGCPPLIRNTYKGETVLRQLKKNAERFLADKEKNVLDRNRNILVLSELFSWYEEDFTEAYGSVFNTAVEFLPEDDAGYARKNKPALEYRSYNWHLNTQ